MPTVMPSRRAMGGTAQPRLISRSLMKLRRTMLSVVAVSVCHSCCELPPACSGCRGSHAVPAMPCGATGLPP